MVVVLPDIINGIRTLLIRGTDAACSGPPRTCYSKSTNCPGLYAGNAPMCVRVHSRVRRLSSSRHVA